MEGEGRRGRERQTEKGGQGKEREKRQTDIEGGQGKQREKRQTDIEGGQGKEREKRQTDRQTEKQGKGRRGPKGQLHPYFTY